MTGILGCSKPDDEHVMFQWANFPSASGSKWRNLMGGLAGRSSSLKPVCQQGLPRSELAWHALFRYLLAG